ncbi:hypothetical protein AAC387_Pa02g3763 [Persea americana]
MAAYLAHVKQLLPQFDRVEVKQIDRDSNSHADALINLAFAVEVGRKRTVEVEMLEKPSIELQPPRQELGIRNDYSTSAYPQSNGQAEILNKVVLDGLKKRLDRAKGRWAEELPSVLWEYRTTPRRSTSTTPFSLAYGMEVVIPFEVGLPTLRYELFDQSQNDVNLALELDLAEERRDIVAIRLAAYQQQLAKGYNQKVKERKFSVGELVLKKPLPGDKNPNEGKLVPNWHGPFKVISAA